MVTKVYLVRHAEAKGNADEFFQGCTSTQLTKKGEQQLAYLAKRFGDIPLDAIYTSPYLRAKRTAEAVNLHHNLPIHEETALHEINGGDWEGMPWSVLPERYPDEYALWTGEMWRFQAPNGESMTEVRHRMINAVNHIAKAHLGESVAVVSHGCAIRNFSCYVEFDDAVHLTDVGWADNTAISLVEYDTDAGWKLIFKNDASHLPTEYSTLHRSQWCRYETAKEENDS